jgi:hypothetical protein
VALSLNKKGTGITLPFTLPQDITNKTSPDARNPFRKKLTLMHSSSSSFWKT